MSLGPVGQRIERKLSQAFAPKALSVRDDSHLHAGHAGARPEGETHFTVEVVSQAFAGKSRIERHRMVHAALSEELKERVHALAISAEAPKRDVRPASHPSRSRGEARSKMTSGRFFPTHPTA